ncbi:MAG: hypothetical protein JXR10_17785 [Cyclobacteriaceae bacterium]
MSALKIKSSLIAAKDKLNTLSIEEQLVSEIEWCLGSFANDQNPEGLYQKAEEAVVALDKFKKDNPRKVSKKIIDDLSKAIKSK